MTGKLFTASILWAILVLASISSAQYPWTMNPHNGHRYKLTGFGTWTNCEAQARAAGGHLVTINDPVEQDWVFRMFGKYNGVSRLLWIGLNDREVEGQFVWISGEAVDFTWWDEGEPNNASPGEPYVAMYYPEHHAGGRWNDWPNIASDPINIPFSGVIELPAIPGDINGDEKVDVGDLGILAAWYGRTHDANWIMGDLNSDGKVNVGDLGILAANYGYGVGGVSVPEPLSLLFLTLGGVFLSRRK